MAARNPAVAIAAVSAAHAGEAGDLALELGLPLLPTGTAPATCTAAEVLLLVAEDGLGLQQTGSGAPGMVRAEIDSARMRHRRRSGHNELLGRAVGVGRRADLRVIDATAGLGRDAAVLADLGCSVVLCERDSLIALLLRDALRRACASSDPWRAALAQRLSLREIDATSLSPAALAPVDVIYLDPMFPSRRKTAAVKKEMRLFQSLVAVSSEDSGEQLLSWALDQDVARVVVKRPVTALPLGNLQPSHSIKGKSVRFDVHVRRSLEAH
jgi:16S rRNA (guanine1516-N2)-methyltransferase